MKIVTTKCTNTIPLGRLGENDYTLVRFDVSGWLAEYPDAVIGLYNQRPGDNSAYPVADLTVNNGVAEWQITNVELTQTGQGKCQLVAIKDSVVIKSMIYSTIVLDALDNSGDVPDPWDSWEDKFIELKGEAEQAASDAESAKNQILGMRAQAITLAPGSEATANYDDGVLTLGIPQGEQGAPGQDGAPGAKGDKGDKGDTGATGAQGQKGEKGDKGDKGDTGDQGQKGDKGDPGDPTELIDDNAGAGVTDKVWSASKSAGEVSDLLSAINSMNPEATSSDIGKALLVKTVEDGKPTSWEYGEAGGGTSDYDDLTDKPQINGNTLSGNKTGANLGLLDAPSTAGASGQVLVSDGNGGQVWGTTGSGTITVDSTLSVSGAAADAKATGDYINGLNRTIEGLGNGQVIIDVVTGRTWGLVLASNGKSTTASNNRWLSRFIPVTPGTTIYISVDYTTERCAFYTSDDYSTVTGGTWTVSSGTTSKVVPSGANYLKIGWHQNYSTPIIYATAGFIDDTAGNGVVNKVWSANKSYNEKNLLQTGVAGTKTAITAIAGKTPFETVDATIETGYYKKDGTRGSGDTYRTATATVTAGEILKVSGYTLANTAFVLIVYFDANNELLSYDYQNSGSAAEEYVDLVVTVPQGAAKIGINRMASSDKPLGIKRMVSIASITDIANTNDDVAFLNAKAENIGRYINYEYVDAERMIGFYNSVSGEWNSNNSYATIRTPVVFGECYLINAYIPHNAGLAQVIFFDDNDEIVGKIYDGGGTTPAGQGEVNKFVYVFPVNATSMAVLGNKNYDNEHYVTVKKCIIKYAHHRQLGVCFGDSTFGNTRPLDDIPTLLSQKTGNTVLNGAFGGCRMSSYNGNYGAFSMYKLADAICTDTWTDQDAAMADPEFEPPAYAAQHLANLKSTDFDKVDFITIAYGTNDWRAGKPLDDEQNPKNANTIAGALRYSLEEIMTTYPQIDIYVLSPLWRVVKLEGDTEENPTGYCDITPNGLPEADQYYLMDVCEVLKKVADEFHVTFINDFDLGINRYNWKNWLVDGTHPNQNGRNLMIGNMIKNIKNILV